MRYELVYRPDSPEIAENTMEVIKRYANRGYGHAFWELTQEHIDALLAGKVLLITDGEYTDSIAMTGPE